MLLLLNLLSIQWVFVLCGLSFAAALHQKASHFLHAVKRMRWLFISLFVIYAFATPGEYIPQFLAYAAPTYEGCRLGLVQIAKLLIALASLSLLFTGSSKHDLIAGLYMLLKPLKLIGLNAERFSARLLLTLDYVESLLATSNNKINFYELDAIHTASESLPVYQLINLQLPAFKLIDKWVMVILIVSVSTSIAWRVLG